MSSALHMPALTPVAASSDEEARAAAIASSSMAPPSTTGIGHTPQAGSVAAVPPHTQTQSTLAPTSEYVRYLLLALPARYIPRGIFGALFEKAPYRDNALARMVAKPGAWLQKKFPHSTPESKAALIYNSAMGVGSVALTASYSWTVYHDIKSIFSEAVAAEIGKPPEQVTFKDLQRSDNRIVQKTLSNFWQRSARRFFTDLLFFPTALVRSSHLGDFMVGVKALQAFGETWKRKTTMFEDLVTFVNNKINPRNGLGQAISVGEIFDLYQHYAQEYNPGHDFSNVLDRGTGEGAVWAQSQPIFERITELMNLTYAYKHKSVIDPKTGHALAQADLPLPKLIYLLGHDLVDVMQPEKTLAAIEIANRYGIGAVKEMQAMLAGGGTLAQVAVHFPVAPRLASTNAIPAEEKNGVIAKGSTVQLDRAESTTPASIIDAHSAIAMPSGQSAPSVEPLSAR
ncbi:MAG: hypothetical protein SFW64_07555 [Alphaproteobacteria bacterium]|nr:hypothetical protein [Alphaproteobacteria bacterium]